ncbi:MAG: sulfite exporter TauE/SafE family protein [Xenococcaceae cyanobacterium]
MLDLLLIFSLGFLGSFGHCVGMCGPLTVAFSLSQKDKANGNWFSSFSFHFLLNLGRILSYALVGGLLGSLSSLLLVSGQFAGIGSQLRQFMVIFTGLLLIWLGLSQINPKFLPKIPILHPLQGNLHNSLNSLMIELSFQTRWWMALVLGIFWGLIPCGFLYTAQIKAIETGSFWLGTISMLAFGLGTMPMMLGVGISASRLSSDRRSQLFRLGGFLTLTIGILTLFRTDAMVDYTGHGALFLLILALIARPLSNWWTAPLQYRRAIGVGAFVLTIAHISYMLDHSLDWNLQAIAFMLPQHQWGLGLGVLAILLMTPAAMTSFDYFQQALGHLWRKIHLLCVPALILAISHTILLGSNYLGELQWSWENLLRTFLVVAIASFVLFVRRLNRF